MGILQSEANHIDVYVCPQCQSTEDAMTVLSPLTDKDYEGLKRILRSLQVTSTHSKIPHVISLGTSDTIYNIQLTLTYSLFCQIYFAVIKLYFFFLVSQNGMAFP